MIRVIVTGACGKMGREVVRAVTSQPDLALVGAVDTAGRGELVRKVAGLPDDGLDLKVTDDLGALLMAQGADVLVDFTNASAAKANALAAVRAGVRPVVGTTGMSDPDVEEIARVVDEAGTAAVIAPNFAIGAVLLIHFCRMAARYLPEAEVIELHHAAKLDAPSGTALATARAIAAARRAAREEGQWAGPAAREAAASAAPGEVARAPRPSVATVEKVAGSRGGEVDGVRVHSVRLPGMVAHQEVIFGGPGQLLTVRHDSLSRESFMPGVLLAVRKVMESRGLTRGLEPLLGLA